MLVLAGPGSGKTTVITNRVLRLVEACKVPPEQILVITFTKAAALEMQQRFLTLLGRPCPSLTFGTFHAVFFHILRQFYSFQPDAIAKESHILAFLTEYVSRIEPDLAKEPDLILSLRQELSVYKGNHRSRKTDTAYQPVCIGAEVFFQVYEGYEQMLRSKGLVDFEDMLLLTRELFCKRPDVLAQWQNTYRYILVDEFQDINPIQYEIVKMLAAPENNLFIVGDDDQSIYGFRGSSPELMLGFPKDFPDARVVNLNLNYRSAPAIIEMADNLISRNQKRFQKENRCVRTEAEPVVLQSVSHVGEENRLVTERVRQLLAGGALPEQIAVLYRTNLQPRSLCRALARNGIPFRIQGSIPVLYTNVHVAPVLSYLKLAVSDTVSRKELLAIANKPVRYLSRQAMPREQVDWEELKAWYIRQDKDYVVERISRLIYDLRLLSGMTPYAAIHYVRKIVGYEQYLLESFQLYEDACSLLDELMSEAKEFQTIPEFLSHCEQETERQQQENAAHRRQHTGIFLHTFHGCKGLEFDHVFIIDCNETLVPHKRAMTPEDIAEERRLLYVAMTRARRTLTLLSLQERFGKELLPSRFLAELTTPLTAYGQGQRILHKTLGSGTICELAGDQITIAFDADGSVKKLSLPYCIKKQLLSALPTIQEA